MKKNLSRDHDPGREFNLKKILNIMKLSTVLF